MKKLITVICILTLIPVLSFAKIKEEKVCFYPSYDWSIFLGRGTKTKSKEGNWKYGYNLIQDGNEYYFEPKAPKGFKVPSYLNRFPIVNKNISIDSFKFEENNFIKFVRNTALGWFDEQIVFGILPDNIWIVVDNTGPWNDFHNKFRPYEDARISIMKTIIMHCEYENRDPTIDEKYIMLYMETCKLGISTYPDLRYQDTYKDEYHNEQWKKDTYFIFGNFRIVGWCLFALFLFILPGIVFSVIKFIFPKGSVFYNAVCVLEAMLGIFVITYWFGNKK